VGINFAEYQRRKAAGLISPEEEAFIERELSALQQAVERNPLQAFEPHSEAQRGFLRADTAIVAAFAGNRFGKTTSLVIKALCELLPREVLPEHLKACKRFDGATAGWIIVPTTDKMYDSLIPALQKWVPDAELKMGKWDGSWSKERRQLNFKNGSTLAFKTYEQHESTLGGAALHFVGYDEPPPKLHREECLTRLIDHGGFEMFAMTPLKTNTGWIRRDIFKKREAPHITVVRGSMHDNPLLDERTKQLALEAYGSDLWRRAREFGDFVDVGGLIYPDFDRCVTQGPFSADFVRSLDVVVGIDPGIRNAGIVWVGFDSQNVAYVFSEALLQDKTPKDYAAHIKAENKRWGLKRVSYVIDPAARQRSQQNGMTVESALLQERIGVVPGQNDHELGFGQLRTRMEHKRFWVSPECRGLRDEADDYAAKEPNEGQDDSQLIPVKGNEHRLDALRYACLERFWDPIAEADAPNRNLGYHPASGLVPPKSVLFAQPAEEAGPMGIYS
jgi:phage terminase large subunit-like protein